MFRLTHCAVRILLILSIIVNNGDSATEPSTKLSDQLQARLLQYVRQKFDVPTGVNLMIVNVQPVKDTGYSALTFSSGGSFGKQELTLYLSPDQRFLISDLFDTQLDPHKEQRARDEAVLKGLTADSTTPSLGAPTAAVTVVEFSDFQCPYCKRFNSILQEVASDPNVRVLFHHYPLPNHSWARVAAEGAACAALEDKTAFWRFNQQLFDNQQVLTEKNIKQKLIDFAERDRSLNLRSFQSCLDKQLSLGLVLKDMNLGAAYDVGGTPTVFINGKKMPAISSALQLREMISDAAQHSREATQSN